MGTTYYVNVYYAVMAPLDAFFVETGDRVAFCATNKQHPVKDIANFCETCGSRVVSEPVRAPSAVFKAFCDSNQYDPAEALHLLRHEGWEWSDEGKSLTVKWYEVNGVNTWNLDEDDRLLAVGFKLSSFDETDGNGPQEIDPDDLELYRKALQEVAEALGLENEPKLYAQLEY